MQSQIQLLKEELKAKLTEKRNATLNYCLNFWTKNRRRVFTAVLIAMLFSFKDISFSVQIDSPEGAAQQIALKKPIPKSEDRTSGFWATVLRVVEALSPVQHESTQKIYNTDEVKKSGKTTEEFGVFDITEFANKKLTPKEQEVRDRQEAYVKQFAEIAQAEMKKYGIPASITLAQGIVETNAGISRLATDNNNHFGIKCFSRKCKKGHCSNFSDDTHKDFFRKYKSVWASYRAHSQLLTAKRYQPLFKHELTDYKNWAHGLKKAGYATDRRYAQKLINIIEDLELYRYDSIEE